MLAMVAGRHEAFVHERAVARACARSPARVHGRRRRRGAYGAAELVVVSIPAFVRRSVLQLAGVQHAAVVVGVRISGMNAALEVNAHALALVLATGTAGAGARPFRKEVANHLSTLIKLQVSVFCLFVCCCVRT